MQPTLFDEWSSVLSAVLYVNPFLPCLPLVVVVFFIVVVVVLFFSFATELMHYSSGLRHASCASGIRGLGVKKNKKTLRDKRSRRENAVVQRQRERES